MRFELRKIPYLLREIVKSEHTVDALRNTLAVIIPIVFFFYIGWPTTGIGVGIGALMICMTDLPGNRTEKFRAAWISTLIFALVAFLAAWSTQSALLMVFTVVGLTFLLTMVGVMGQRMSAIGLMGIILATFTIGLKPKNPLLYANYILFGGAWYYLISLLQISIFPYRSLNRAIAQTIRETAELLFLRAKGYNPLADLTGFNRQNIRLHLRLANQHELIRQLLLSDKRTMQQRDTKAQLLLEKSISLIDLYEQVSAVHYDYPYLRKKLANTGALPLIKEGIEVMAKLLRKPNSPMLESFDNIIADLKKTAAKLPVEEQALVSQILANIDEIFALINAIHSPNSNRQSDESSGRYTDFLTTSPVQTTAFKKHFSLQSSTFRFSLRLSALSLAALLLINWLSPQHYSYWLLLTMVIVSRPSYGQTLKRNVERLSGTLLGLLIGWGLTQTDSISLQLFISVFGLFGFFAFNRIAYGVSVVCITVSVILCLNAYEGNLWQLLTDRVVFTIGGVLLCLLATFLFPIWNAPRLGDLFAQVINSNLDYFKSASALTPFDLEKLHESKLARKQSHRQLAQLSEAISAALKEPLRRRLNWRLIKRMQLLNFQFNVLNATFASSQKQGLSLLSLEDIKNIEADLFQLLDQIQNMDWSNPKELPMRDEKPLNLNEVCKEMLMLTH
ncbi:FUSC family membrane protein [Pedobacter sp.]